MNADVLAVIVASLSLAVSIGIGIATLKLWLRQNAIGDEQTSLGVQANRLDLRMLRIEEARRGEEVVRANAADLSAGLDRRRGKALRYYLVIQNIGSSEARRVDVRIDDIAFTEHPAGWQRVEMPIEVIGPGGHWEQVLHTSLQQRPPNSVQITWDDDSGGGEWQSVVASD